MDLYTLEYISLMDNNTTTVVYAGSAHTRFLFNELVVLENYTILEVESKKYIKSDFYDNIGRCEKIFPSFDTNVEELNNNYNNVKDLYNDKSGIVLSDEHKNNFINNMLLMTFQHNMPVISNVELQFGYWEDIMANNTGSLFSQNYPYH